MIFCIFVLVTIINAMESTSTYTAKDLAIKIDEILRGDTERRFWSNKDILERLIKSHYFDEELDAYFSNKIKEYEAKGRRVPSYIQTPSVENIIDYLRDVYDDKIKKAKSGLRQGLGAYGLDFQTTGGATKGQKFRYPENLTVNPVEAWQRKLKIDSQSLDYKFSKVVKGLFTKYIADRRVVTFDCVPSFDKNDLSHVKIHPHYIKEYNGRLFLFGRAVLNAYSQASSQMNLSLEAGCFPLDRIDEDSIKVAGDEEYIPASIDYKTYFDDIVGVTHYTDNETGELKFPVEKIVIKTHTAYAHGRIVTRPLHKSQIEEMEFDSDKGYGLVSITVSYNKELLGVLFGYEGSIEVISPENVRMEIAYEVRELNNRYW